MNRWATVEGIEQGEPSRRAAMLASAVAGLLVGAVLAAMVVAIVATRLLGFQLLAVASESMAPALRSGDLVVVKPASIGEIDAGDVVVFTTGQDAIPVIHRVLGVNEYETVLLDAAGVRESHNVERRLVTGGDANAAPDFREVTATQLRGKAWATIPGGSAILGIPLKTAFAIFGTIVVLAWVWWEFVGRRRRGAWIAAAGGLLLMAGVATGPAGRGYAWMAPVAAAGGAAMVAEQPIERDKPPVDRLPPAESNASQNSRTAEAEPISPPDPRGPEEAAGAEETSPSIDGKQRESRHEQEPEGTPRATTERSR